MPKAPTTEEALRRKEAELAHAQRLANVGSWHWYPETDTVVWSDELYRISGIDPTLPAVSYGEHSKLYTPESWGRLRQAVEEALRNGTPYELELEMIRADGARRWVIARGDVLRDDTGRIVQLQGTVQDITERRKTLEALSGMSRRLIEAQETERTRIARDLHDDFGQRLAMLSVSLEQLKRAVPDADNGLRLRLEELRKQVQDISAGIHALSHELHSSKLRHMGMVNAMRGFCAELSEQQKVEIDFTDRDVADTVPQHIATCLFRVLQEALHNGVKHSKARHFDVTVQATTDAVCLTVADSGLGFDPGAGIGGQGIGLSSMQERLKLVDGVLSIESQPGRGTTIRARVPLTPAAPVSR
jgi:PAS domain S-box-containing protein